MIATIPYIESKFVEFNNAYFGGLLPKLPIVLSDAKGFLGQITFYKSQKADGKFVYSNFKLKINTRLDMPESELEDTIIHEMIHYYIGYNQIEDASAHGPMFLNMMNLINEKYGRHISVSKKTTKDEQDKLIDDKPRHHFFCVVTLPDKKIGIKVVPRIIQRIQQYDSQVKKEFAKQNVKWYYSSDPYFNKFPSSMAARLNVIDYDEIKPFLESATEVIIEKNVILPKHK